MSKLDEYVHPITVEAAKEVASNMRADDRRELEDGHGEDPLEYLTMEARRGICVYFCVPNGRIAGMAGVEKNGMVWMLCTLSLIHI